MVDSGSILKSVTLGLLALLATGFSLGYFLGYNLTDVLQDEIYHNEPYEIDSVEGLEQYGIKDDEPGDKFPSLLVVVRTIKRDYSSRLKLIRETWGKNMENREDQMLLIVGDDRSDNYVVGNKMNRRLENLFKNVTASSTSAAPPNSDNKSSNSSAPSPPITKSTPSPSATTSTSYPTVDLLNSTISSPSLQYYPHDLVTAKCPPGDLNKCCRTAYMVVAAWELIQSRTPFDWIYLIDDDTYLLPDNLQRQLPTTEEAAIMGVWGCASVRCGGLCGGGGLLINKYMMPLLLFGYDHSRFTSFEEELAATCLYCSGWDDIGLGRIAISHRKEGLESIAREGKRLVHDEEKYELAPDGHVITKNPLTLFGATADVGIPRTSCGKGNLRGRNQWPCMGKVQGPTIGLTSQRGRLNPLRPLVHVPSSETKASVIFHSIGDRKYLKDVVTNPFYPQYSSTLPLNVLHHYLVNKIEVHNLPNVHPWLLSPEQFSKTIKAKSEASKVVLYHYNARENFMGVHKDVVDNKVLDLIDEKRRKRVVAVPHTLPARRPID